MIDFRTSLIWCVIDLVVYVFIFVQSGALETNRMSAGSGIKR